MREAIVPLGKFYLTFQGDGKCIDEAYFLSARGKQARNAKTGVKSLYVEFFLLKL